MSPPRINVSELHVGSSVYSRDGEKIGKLRFLMVDPDSAAVSHLVLEKGMMLPKDVLAPVTAVGKVLHRGIFLTLESSQVRELPEFMENRYLQRERNGNNSGGRRSKGRYRRHRDRDRD